ncbi:MAG: non-ribosomal peptide synthetase, partial [bacterium]|nr:non-ribosomal peptide synthetase [bacterium]
IDDNFFDIGGHSLRGTVLIAKVHKAFNARVSLAELFEFPTVRELSSHIKGAAEDKFIPLEPAEEREYYPISSAQKRLYIIQQMDPGNTTYNIPNVMELPGRFEKGTVASIFEALLRRHEGLRTAIEVVGKDPIQRIYPYPALQFSVDYYDITKDEGDPEQIIGKFLRPFDLSKAPLLRVSFIKKTDEKNTLLVDMHHIISDGLSMGILTNEVIRLYQGETLPPLRFQYKDYSQWQNRQSAGGEMTRQEQYWLKKFECAGEIPLLNIPSDYPRPAVQSFEGRSVIFEFDRDDAQRLRELAKKENVTLFMLFLALLNVFLSKISGQDDIIVGTAVAGRSHADLQQIIGMFINMLALRNHPGDQKDFTLFLREVKQTVLDAFDHQDYQFEDLVDKVLSERDSRRNPLVDVVYSFGDDNPGTAAADQPDEPFLEPLFQDNEPIKFDMVVVGQDTGRDMYLTIVYCTKLFKEESIQRFIGYWREIVSAVAGNAAVLLEDINISTGLGFAESEAYDNQSEFEF